jgi:predicted metal-dependent phosphoesterase TrpH
LNGKIDLHAHTTASDGQLSPAALVELALSRGLSLLAVTDHDSTDGIAGALIRAAGTPLEVWPGVEISTDVPRTEVHMLGYFVDPDRPEFKEILSRLRDSRLWRAEQMVSRLKELGMPVRFERVRELAGTGAVGRPHVAQAMVEAGHVPSQREAFDLYLHRNGPAYVERFKIEPREAIQVIRAAGGMPVLAHPTYINPGGDNQFDLSTFVNELREYGLVGIECYYADYPPETVLELAKVAREFDLIPTGGSDFHGVGLYPTDLGEPVVPTDTVERMRAWRQAHQ